ncbi:MAG: hypothetical protein AABZ23_04530 [Deltaproteobacteria bacterium]
MEADGQAFIVKDLVGKVIGRHGRTTRAIMTMWTTASTRLKKERTVIEIIE